jgi:hypothetical protein
LHKWWHDNEGHSLFSAAKMVALSAQIAGPVCPVTGKWSQYQPLPFSFVCVYLYFKVLEGSLEYFSFLTKGMTRYFKKILKY